LAYLRLSEDCEIYFFAHVGGGFECCGCQLMPLGPESIVRLANEEEAVGHLAKHEAAGHKGFSWEVVEEILGYRERRPDPVLDEMVTMARADGGKVMTADADVPVDVRMDVDLAAFAKRLADAPDNVHVREQIAKEFIEFLKGARRQ
jgi:hypothetical protein